VAALLAEDLAAAAAEAGKKQQLIFCLKLLFKTVLVL
jgi:hypothetical protein